jgi:hypothetical protein
MPHKNGTKHTNGSNKATPPTIDPSSLSTFEIAALIAERDHLRGENASLRKKLEESDATHDQLRHQLDKLHTYRKTVENLP